MQENICRKYGITQEQLAESVTRCCKLLSPKFAGGKQVRLAILCLLCNGDIPPERMITNNKLNKEYDHND